jgi:hypothetical protein
LSSLSGWLSLDSHSTKLGLRFRLSSLSGWLSLDSHSAKLGPRFRLSSLSGWLLPSALRKKPPGSSRPLEGG